MIKFISVAPRNSLKHLTHKHPVPYFVYLLECRDGSYYCGYSADAEKRVEKHNQGKASKYTSKRRPVRLIYSEQYDTKSEAMKREYAIKQLTRTQKIQLIQENKQ